MSSAEASVPVKASDPTAPEPEAKSPSSTKPPPRAAVAAGMAAGDPKAPPSSAGISSELCLARHPMMVRLRDESATALTMECGLWRTCGSGGDEEFRGVKRDEG